MLLQRYVAISGSAVNVRLPSHERQFRELAQRVEGVETLVRECGRRQTAICKDMLAVMQSMQTQMDNG